jgi:hypothetical protein
VVHSDAFYPKLTTAFGIPPTGVGGLFKSVLREDLKYPPTAVGGIKYHPGGVCRNDLN